MASNERIDEWQYGHYLTIRDVLDSPTLAKARVEAFCPPEALDRPVRWVHVADAVRTGALLQGSELLLTTGIAWSDRADERIGMIATFAQRSVAAIVLELGSHWRQVPADVVNACQHYDIPLLAIHDEVKYVELTEYIHTLLLEHKVRQVNAIHDVTESFTSLMVNGAPTTQILAHASRLLQCPVVLEDLSHQVVAYAEGHMPPSTLLHNWSEKSRRWSAAIGNYGTLTQCVTVDADNAIGARAVVRALTSTPNKHQHHDAELWTMIDVQARGVAWGRLFYRGRSLSDAGGDHILSQAAITLAMERLGSTNPYSWVDLIEKTAIERLVHNKYTTVHGVQEVLSASGFRMEGRHLFALLMEHHGSYIEPTVYRKEIRKTFQDADFLATELESNPRLVIAALSIPADPVHHNITEPLHAMAERICDSHDAKLRIICSSASETTLQLSALIRQLSLATPTPMPRARVTIVPLSRTPLENLLLTLRDDVRVQHYVNSTLDPLLMYDKNHHGDLVETLTAVLAHPTSRTAAAQRLHLSRTALYGRIATIERLLDMDLSDGETIFSLSLALKSMRGSADASTLKHNIAVASVDQRTDR
ncbi:PucR family transcriptional regulator [Corynebacterium sp.]|uniref:PucR family transcriptional regulator n=1 Tax=Corynebacterium sp. TaxID=1720 RepID=UPI0026DDB582|nr:PucR family transcriptional regulator [Corynebacterium sp.]MDO5077505.1 PucR family transcriptional regulator [Corynebacterium sp.]